MSVHLVNLHAEIFARHLAAGALHLRQLCWRKLQVASFLILLASVSTESKGQLAGVWTRCILEKNDGTSVAVQLATNQEQCDVFARQCAGDDGFARIVWRTSAVVLREPFSVCTPDPNRPPPDFGPVTKCIVELRLRNGSNERRSIPQASSASDCQQRALTCAQETTGQPQARSWWVPNGAKGPASECRPWN